MGRRSRRMHELRGRGNPASVAAEQPSPTSTDAGWAIFAMPGAEPTQQPSPTARSREGDPSPAAQTSTSPARADRAPTRSGALEELKQLARERRAVCDRIDAVVDELVANGVGWPRIAAALGVTRQGARQTYLRRRLEAHRTD